MSKKVFADRPLNLTKDQTRIVEADDPESYFVLASRAGKEIPEQFHAMYEDQVVPSTDDLDSKTRKELLAYADRLDIKVKRRDTVAVLLSKIRAALEPDDESDDDDDETPDGGEGEE